MARETIHSQIEETAPLGTDVIPIGRVGRRLRKVTVSTLREYATPFNVQNEIFGAIGNGIADDTAAIQAAIDAAFTAGGGEVIFPAGTYLVAPSGTGTYIISKSNVTLRGCGPASIIKVKDDAGNYRTVIGATAAVTNFTLDNLTIDQNYAGNTTCDVQTTDGSQQFVLHLIGTNTTDVTVRHCQFDSCTGINTIVVNASGAKRVDVSHNYFLFKQGVTTASPWYDNSAVYLEAADAMVTANHFFSDDYADFPNCAVEVHGPGAVVSDNLCDGYASCCHFVTTFYPANHQQTYGLSFTGNTVRRANEAITLITAADSAASPQTMRVVSITGNTVDLYQDLQNRETCYGIGFSVAANTMAIEDVTITGNTIRFQAPDERSGVLTPQTGISLGATGNIRNVKVANNTIVNAPHWGLACYSASGVCERIELTDNLLIDCGINTLHPTASNRAAICLGGGAVGDLTDITVDRNTIIDTGAVSLNGLSAILSLNSSGTHTRVRLGRNIIRTASGLSLPVIVDDEAGITANDGQEVVAYTTPFAPYYNSGTTKVMTLTGDTFILAPTGQNIGIRGQRICFIFIQDGTGGWVMNFNTGAGNYKANWTPDTTAGNVNTIEFEYMGTHWVQVATATGL